MNRFTTSLAAAVALLACTTAHAGVAVFAPSGGVTADHDPGNPVNLGNVFTVTSNSKATSLGFYTPTNLVGGGQTVGLYTIGGTLLASTFVSVPVNAPGQYAYQAITPVQLTAGQQYVVVTQTGQNAWAYAPLTATGATYNYNVYAYGATLTYPTNTAGASGPGYMGPNLTLGVPEPASWALMIGGFGMVGAATRRRRSSNAVYA